MGGMLKGIGHGESSHLRELGVHGQGDTQRPSRKIKAKGLKEKEGVWPSQESDLLWVIWPPLAFPIPPPASVKGLPPKTLHFICPHPAVGSTPPCTSHLWGSQVLQCRFSSTAEGAACPPSTIVAEKAALVPDPLGPPQPHMLICPLTNRPTPTHTTRPEVGTASSTQLSLFPGLVSPVA